MSSTDIYTLPHVKQMASGKQLHSRGSSAQCSVMTCSDGQGCSGKEVQEAEDTHTHTHTHMYIYTHTCTHRHIYTCAYTHVYTHVHIHTCVHTCIYVYTHLCIHTHIYTHLQLTHIAAQQKPVQPCKAIILQ